tara:strand:- start:152 stop:595 length:444 start_codon:yes stop_codon:yes gene_type:complete
MVSTANLPGMVSTEEIVVVSDRDAVRPLALLRRAIFGTVMVTPDDAFKPRWGVIREAWCARLNNLRGRGSSRPVTEGDFAEIHELLVMVQSSIKEGAIAPWFHEGRWRARMQHARDVPAFAEIVACLWSAIIGAHGPEWMLTNEQST